MFHDDVIHDSSKIANAFNDHFTNTGPKLASEINVNENHRSFLEYLNCQNDVAFHLKEVNSSIVLDLLSNLSKTKATGLDEISSRLL